MYHRICCAGERLGLRVRANKTIYDHKSGCGYTWAAQGVDHECRVVVLKTGCKDGKICMSRRNVMKTVIALGKKHLFHHENIVYQKKRPYLKEL